MNDASTFSIIKIVVVGKSNETVGQITNYLKQENFVPYLKDGRANTRTYGYYHKAENGIFIH